MPSLNTENAILSNAIKVNSSYNVGIGGAASGSYKLQVTGASNFTGAYTGFQFNSAGAYPAYNTYFGAIGTNFSNSNSELDIWNTVGGGFVFRRQTGASAQTALMTIANSGNIAINGVPTEIGGFTSLIINNNSNGSFLDLNNSGVNNLRLLSLSLVDQRIQAQGNLTFYTAAIARMAITSDGNVGIGTSSPLNIANFTSLQVNGVNSGLIMVSNNANIKGHLYVNASGIQIGASSNNLVSFNTNDTEKMRLTAAGQFMVGGSLGLVGRIVVFNESTGISIMDSSNNGGLMRFYNVNAVQIGSITTDASSTFYNTSSDYRLKEDLKEINGLAKVSAIKVYDFKWKNNDARMDGFIAHELSEVIPYAVHGQKDGEEMQSVDYSKIVPILVKAIQELNQTVQDQQQQINSLINR
jgi:hypothetical protein